MIDFTTSNSCIEYLKKRFYVTDFIHIHTRKDLAKILQLIEPQTVSTMPEHLKGRAFTGMCKKRQCRHIEYYLQLHNIKCCKPVDLNVALKKEDFVKCIKDIQSVDERIEEINTVLSKNCDDSIYCPPSLHTALITVLQKIFLDSGHDFSYIDYFIYELDYGKNWHKDSLRINNESIPLKTPEDLYEALLENMRYLKNKKNDCGVEFEPNNKKIFLVEINYGEDYFIDHVSYITENKKEIDFITCFLECYKDELFYFYISPDMLKYKTCKEKSDLLDIINRLATLAKPLKNKHGYKIELLKESDNTLKMHQLLSDCLNAIQCLCGWSLEYMEEPGSIEGYSIRKITNQNVSSREEAMDLSKKMGIDAFVKEYW